MIQTKIPALACVALALALPSCRDGSSYVLVSVGSGTSLTIASLSVTVSNAGQSITLPVTRGGSFSIPPSQSFVLQFGSMRRGDVAVDVRALGTGGGELAHVSGSTTLIPNGTAQVSVMLTPTVADMGIGGDMPQTADLAMLDMATSDHTRLLQWEPQNSNTTDTLFGVWGTGNNVFAVGGDWQGTHGTVVQSKDGGMTWTVQTVGNMIFDAVWGSGAADVYAVGDFGTVYHSINGGASWVKVTVNTTQALTGAWGTGGDAYFVGGNANATTGTIVHSTDGGLSWSVSTAGTTALRAVWGSGSKDVYVVGFKGAILHSTDGGITWIPQTSNVTSNLLDIWGSSGGDVYVAGFGGTILHSIGNGAAWVPLNSNTMKDLWSV